MSPRRAPSSVWHQARPAATLENHGLISIASGYTLSTAEKIVNDTGGQINSAGTGLLTSSGVFDQGAGTTSGQPYS